MIIQLIWITWTSMSVKGKLTYSRALHWGYCSLALSHWYVNVSSMLWWINLPSLWKNDCIFFFNPSTGHFFCCHRGWVGLWGFLWWAPSAKGKDHHRVSSGWSSVWHRSNTGLSSTQYEQIPIILGAEWQKNIFGLHTFLKAKSASILHLALSCSPLPYVLVHRVSTKTLWCRNLNW